MKVKELRERKEEELQSLEKDLRRELSEVRMKISLGTLTETARPRQIRRDIARVLTLLRGKEER